MIEMLQKMLSCHCCAIYVWQVLSVILSEITSNYLTYGNIRCILLCCHMYLATSVS